MGSLILRPRRRLAALATTVGLIALLVVAFKSDTLHPPANWAAPTVIVPSPTITSTPGWWGYLPTPPAMAQKGTPTP